MTSHDEGTVMREALRLQRQDATFQGVMQLIGIVPAPRGLEFWKRAARAGLEADARRLRQAEIERARLAAASAEKARQNKASRAVDDDELEEILEDMDDAGLNITRLTCWRMLEENGIPAADSLVDRMLAITVLMGEGRH